MRIARVLTVCAVLTSIGMVVDAETARSRRRPESKEQSGLLRPEDNVDPDEITFTTLRPETTTTTTTTSRSNVHVGSNKSYRKVRPSRSAGQRNIMRLRTNSNRSKANRRRRQLQRLGSDSDKAKTIHELNRINRIENDQIEAIQGPADAFEEGSIRIEPVYRVTKNKNILDAIVNVLRRIVDPPKSIGPLVGPFHFPGVGDKVYVRLLEPVQPDHLVVRLISHVPADEVESTLVEQNVVTPSELIEHAEILPETEISHPLDQTNDLPSIVHDSSSSSSNVAVHILKPNASDAKLGKAWKTYKYKLHLKHPENTKWKNEVLPRSPISNDRANISFHNSFHLPVNEPSRNHDLTPVTRASIDHHLDFHRFHAPANVSEPAVVHARFEPSFPTPRVPIYAQPRSTDPPKYSIEFASKKMRYLNLDGSVVSADEKPKSDTVFRFDDRPWIPFRRMYTKKLSTTESDRTMLRDRRDNAEVNRPWERVGTHSREVSPKESTRSDQPEEKKGESDSNS